MVTIFNILLVFEYKIDILFTSNGKKDAEMLIPTVPIRLFIRKRFL